MARRALIACAVVSLVMIGGQALAQDSSSEVEALREQLRSTALQLRELQDQQAAATPAPAAPSPDTDALKAKLAAAQAQLRAARRSAGAVAGLKAALAKAQSDNTALTSADAAELDKYKSAYNQASEQVRDLTAERDQLKAQLALATNVATACQAKNFRLVVFAEDLLTAYRKVGLGQVLAAREPFIGMRRVELENIAQGREDTVYANRCDTRLDAVAPPKPQPAPGG